MSDKLIAFSVSDLLSYLKTYHGKYSVVGHTFSMFTEVPEESKMTNHEAMSNVLVVFGDHPSLRSLIAVNMNILSSGDPNIPGSVIRKIGSDTILQLDNTTYEFIESIDNETLNFYVQSINSHLPVGNLFVAGKNELVLHIESLEVVDKNDIGNLLKAKKSIKKFVTYVANGVPLAYNFINTYLTQVMMTKTDTNPKQ